MPIYANRARWIVPDVSIQVERLRIAEGGVGHVLRLIGPLGGEEAVHGGAIVLGSEVLEPRQHSTEP